VGSPRNLAGRHRKALVFDVGSFAASRYISAGDPGELAPAADAADVTAADIDAAPEPCSPRSTRCGPRREAYADNRAR
jgi:hypothetical protein